MKEIIKKTIEWKPLIVNDWPFPEQPCLIENFFKNNPDSKLCMISCPCPRCTPYC